LDNFELRESESWFGGIGTAVGQSSLQFDALGF